MRLTQVVRKCYERLWINKTRLFCKWHFQVQRENQDSKALHERRVESMAHV